MISCPKCNATLPDGADRCQFCGQTFTPFRSPNAPRAGRQPGLSDLKWVNFAYYGIAGWWAISNLIRVAVMLSRGVSGFDMFGLAISGATALVGIGLIFRVELARGIVNILCFLQILFGAMWLLAGFFMTPVMGVMGGMLMIFAAIQIALAGVMIFVIGETEIRGPNF